MIDFAKFALKEKNPFLSTLKVSKMQIR
jgi:hypothetical protein